jgi:hypothetical protein
VAIFMLGCIPERMAGLQRKLQSALRRVTQRRWRLIEVSMQVSGEFCCFSERSTRRRGYGARRQSPPT